jgi:2-dehydropantoate 2-reductase
VGQVPRPHASPFGVIGNGRAARHFTHYCRLLGLSVRVWSRHDPDTSPTDALAACKTIVVAIRDAAIVPFIETWPDLRAKRLVHFSGSLMTGLADVAHPLMAFGPDLYDLDTYRQIPFVLDAGGSPLAELLPGLPNPSFAIPAAQRPYYHALCVMAGNFSTLLWRRLFEELDARFGIPASAAHPYLAQITANLIANPMNALTGPLSRGDVEAIRTNLQALEGDSFHAIYSAFVDAYEQHQ